MMERELESGREEWTGGQVDMWKDESGKVVGGPKVGGYIDLKRDRLPVRSLLDTRRTTRGDKSGRKRLPAFHFHKYWDHSPPHSSNSDDRGESLLGLCIHIRSDRCSQHRYSAVG